MAQPFEIGDMIARAIDANPTLPFDTVMLGVGCRIAIEGGALGEARTPCAVLADQVYRLLAAGRFDLCAETSIQGEMERVLVATFGPAAVSREHRLGPKDRPDFLIDGRIVIEVKGLRHRQPAVLRQLKRYADHPRVEWIILATARAMRMCNAFAYPGGRRVEVRTLNLGRAWL